MDDLEEMLNKQKEIMDGDNNVEIIPLNSKSEITKADQSATLFDLITMIDKVVTLTIKDAKFIPTEGMTIELDAMNTIDTPIITFKTISRKPIKEKKPRIRQVIEENDEFNEKRIGEVLGQKFQCYLQFNIFATEYKTAEKVMQEFEDTIIKYTGYFKKKGVAEIMFSEQITDDSYEKLRETLSIRNLIFYVEIEKLTVIFKEKIKEITLQIENELKNKKEE